MSEIYALTDDVLTPNSSVFLQVREILDSGVKLVQYRSKLPRQDETLIASLISLCEDYGAKLIINDNVALAKKLHAHGVHIGIDDADPASAREFLGSGSIIGVTCYSDIKRAKIAQSCGASYAAFGAMFASSTKKEAPLCPHEIVQMAKRELEIPVAIIGGISEQNLAQILALNPDYIALVSAIYRPNSISQNIKNLQGIINGYN